MDDRRTCERSSAFLNAEIYALDEAGSKSSSGLVLNVSRSGACVAVCPQFYSYLENLSATNTTIRLAISNKKFGRRRHCSLVWQRRAVLPGGTAFFLLGIRFNKLLRQRIVDRLEGEALTNPAILRTAEDLPADFDSLIEELEYLWGFKGGISNPLRNTVARALENGATRVVVQHDYDDELHRVEHISLYHEIFGQTAACKRLFFFREVGDEVDLVGAIVIRPFALGLSDTALGQVGRSVIAPMIGQSSTSSSTIYCLATVHNVFALGNLYRIKAVQYSQQDTLGSRCAQVALGMMSSFLHKLLDIKELSPAEVRLVGTGSKNHFFPASGLTRRDSMRVVRAMGATPVFYSAEPRSTDSPFRHTSRDFLMELLHIYLDSHLPVMLTMTRDRSTPVGHVLLAVGHSSMAQRSSIHRRTCVEFDTSTSHLRDFIVHDDAVGPYLRLPARVGDELPKSRNDSTINYDALWNESFQENVDGILVPLPPGVRLTVDWVLVKLMGLFQTLGPVYQKALAIVNPEAAEEATVVSLLNALCNKNVICNTYLDLSNRFRQNVASSNLAQTDDIVYLDEVSLPKFVWVVEFTTKHYFSGPEPYSQFLGFILLDATTSPDSGEPFLVLRLPGVFFVTDPRLRDGWASSPCPAIAFDHLNHKNFAREGVVVQSATSPGHP